MNAISIQGARVNNLRDVTLDVPKDAMTVFVGLSGSGKSSLVLGTIAAEAQRQLNETHPAWVRDRLPRIARPEATALRGLTPAVVVDQRRVTGSARSTVGTMTDISTALRVLFSRAGTPSAGESSAYSFNDPSGMCPECEGLGVTRQVDLERLIDGDRTLAEGAIRFPAWAPGSWRWQIYADSGVFDPDKPLREFSDDERELLLRGRDFKVLRGTREGPTSTGNVYEGLLDAFERMYLRRDPRELKRDERAALAAVVHDATCGRCEGQRLNDAARASRIAGHNIADLTAMEVADLLELLPTLPAGDAASLVEEAVAGLRRIDAVGLGYLSLDRPVPTLSGGEAQRLKTVRHLGSSLTGMTYVFDEPSVGLHADDVRRLIGLLRELCAAGNTVLVVEHDRTVIEAADHVVELGPGAGSEGGSIVFEGPPAALRRAPTTTGRALRRRPMPKAEPRTPTGALTIAGAARHNLRDVTVDVPLGVFTAVTGVAGSGKSTLIAEVLPRQHPGVSVLDQSPVPSSPRSTPASYVGALQRIRTRFAEASGTTAGLFSFNSAGACPTCRGRGTLTIDLAYMAPVVRRCDRCAGRRFNDEALSHRWAGKTIADVLALTVDDALRWLEDDGARARLQPLQDVGLGHLALGRELGTLSGGERQRLKIADRLGDHAAVLVLDEPTSGLHPADVETLLALVDRLVDAGNTIVAIEHDADVVAHADWIIELGPGAGRHGGRVTFEGPPARFAGIETDVRSDRRKPSV